jgi:plastocyanin
MRVGRRAGRLAVAAFALLVLGLASSASAAPSAATQSVSVANFAFSPTSATINIGDSVKWTNSDAATHTVTADAGGFNATLGPSGGTFTFQFTSAGTFAYHCTVHPSMTGSVVVRSAATAPPTPIPTPVPTLAPTPRPTVAPTSPATAATPSQPTTAPTPEPTFAPSPTVAPTSTATEAPVTTVPVTVASPTNAPTTQASRATAAPPQDGAPIGLIVGGVIVLAGLGALAWVLLRR